MKYFSILLILSLLLCGCSVFTELPEAPPTSNSLADSTTNSTYETTLTNESAPPIFKVCDDTLIHSNANTAPIHGTRLSAENSTNGLDERFAESKNTTGVFPPYGAITLVFEHETPIQITWYIDDGYGFEQNKKGTVITNPSRRTTFSLRENLNSALSSDLGNRPNRKLRIVCQYLDKQIEYLMLIDSTPAST